MDELVPKKHILRQLNEALDFSIVHDWVAPLIPMMTDGRPHRPREQNGVWKTKRHMKIFMAKRSRTRPTAA
jgi:hypothetical protein